MLGNQILGSWWIVCSWLEAAPLAGPFGAEQCSTVQGWVGFSGIRKRCWKQLFLPPCLQILLSWSWKEPGSRKPFLHWQPAASSSKQPAPKASPHSCCQGTTSTAPSTAAASRHLPFLLPSSLCKSSHNGSQQNPAKPGRYLSIWVVFNVGASLD